MAEASWNWDKNCPSNSALELALAQLQQQRLPTAAAASRPGSGVAQHNPDPPLAFPGPPPIVQNVEIAELPRLRERVRRYVDNAVDLLPVEKKQAYLEALRKAPQVVNKETDPLQFVRYGDYNVWAGAERLCSYWTERKTAFGENRFFLPLILTGKGALSRLDVHTLQAGYPCILPNDRNGHQVVWFDQSNWLPKVTDESRLRCIFYVNKILAQETDSQTEGVLAFVPIVSPKMHDFDPSFLIRAFALITSVMPVKYHLHKLIIPNTKRPTLVQEFLKSGLIASLQSMQLQSVEIHIEREQGELASILETRLSMPRTAIPFSIGGDYKFEDFFVACIENEEREREEYKNMLATLPDPEAYEPKKTGAELEEERKLVDLMHSRRKRERKRHETESLKKESSIIVDENNNLKAEQDRLEALIAHAGKVIANLPRPWEESPSESESESSKESIDARAERLAAALPDAYDDENPNNSSSDEGFSGGTGDGPVSCGNGADEPVSDAAVELENDRRTMQSERVESTGEKNLCSSDEEGWDYVDSSKSSFSGSIDGGDNPKSSSESGSDGRCDSDDIHLEDPTDHRNAKRQKRVQVCAVVDVKELPQESVSKSWPVGVPPSQDSRRKLPAANLSGSDVAANSSEMVWGTQSRGRNGSDQAKVTTSSSGSDEAAASGDKPVPTR